jgi:hypothetical protein
MQVNRYVLNHRCGMRCSVMDVQPIGPHHVCLLIRIVIKTDAYAQLHTGEMSTVEGLEHT